MGKYYESFRVEAREQLRLVLAYKFGHPQADAEKYIEALKHQADPPDEEEAAHLGLSGFKQLRSMFGSEVKEDDVGRVLLRTRKS